MEKIDEISFGSRSWILRVGSLVMMIMVILIMYIGYKKISVPEYAEVQILNNEKNIYLLTKFQLNSNEQLTIEGFSFEIHLIPYKKTEYIIDQKALSKENKKLLSSGTLKSGRILIGNKSLFGSLLPIDF